jgi:xylulokinase
VLSRPAAYLGIDAGTSSCKAVVIDDDGSILARSHASYAVNRGHDGSVTGDANEWLAAVQQTARGCADALDGRNDVLGLALTAPAHGAVLVNDEGEPLAPVLLGSDRRPHPVATALAQRLSPALHETTWCTPGAGWTLPQLVWASQSGDVAWQQIRYVLMAKDYLRYRLTGEPATDPSDAAGTAFFDQVRGTWSPELLAEAKLVESQLPPVVPSLTAAGRLAPAWAARMGLRAGTPVATGATDTVAELCGLGALLPGSGLVKVASTGTVVTVTNVARPDPRWLTYPHAVPGRWASFSVHNTAGTSRTWIEAQLGGDRGDLEERAALIRPGSDGLVFLPFLEGERSPYWQGEIRGAFIGLTSGHGRGHLLRAVLEGVACSLRMGRDTLRAGGLGVTSEPYLSGGGMDSALWRQIVVGVLATEARHASGNGPAYGSALIARSMASGRALPDHCLGGVTPVHPDQDEVNQYAEHYGVYAHLADLFARMTSVPAGHYA